MNFCRIMAGIPSAIGMTSPSSRSNGDATRHLEYRWLRRVVLVLAIIVPGLIWGGLGWGQEPGQCGPGKMHCPGCPVGKPCPCSCDIPPPLPTEGTTTGRIAVYHLNSLYPDRGSCIMMNPALPNTGWACVYQNHALYNQLNDLLREGYFAGKTCQVTWSANDTDGHHIIDWAQCQ